MLSNPIVVDLRTGEAVDSIQSKADPLKGALTLTAYNLQSFLISGGLTKSDYIFLMLRLLYRTNQDVTIDMNELAETLSCAGVTAEGKDKEINFTLEDVQVEIAKLAKKGLLTTYETPIQLKLSDVK